MGDGPVSPEYSPESSGRMQFDERVSDSVNDGDSGSGTQRQVTGETSAGSNDGSSSPTTSDRGGVDGSIGSESALQWQGSDKTPARFFAVGESGYSDELASHFKSMSNTELREKVDGIYEESGFETADSRFVAGVLASRSDTDFSASDMYRVNVSATATDDLDADITDERELVNNLSEEFDEVFEQMDEYVAGKVASNIQEINVQETVQREINGKVKEVESAGAYDPSTGQLYFHPRTAAGIDGADEPVSTIPHEVGHAVLTSYGLEAGTTRNINQRSYRTDFAGERSNRSKAFRDSLSDAACNIRDSVIPGETFSTLSSRTEGNQAPVRKYQLKNSGEMIAVGHSVYQSDIVTASSLQPDMVEHIDEFVTGHGWEEVSFDEVTVEGVGLDHPSKDPSHLPAQRDGGEGLRDSVGEVVRVEVNRNRFEEAAGANELQVDGVDPMSDNELRRVAGYAVDASDGSLTVMQNGREVEIPEEYISEIKERRWDEN